LKPEPRWVAPSNKEAVSQLVLVEYTPSIDMLGLSVMK